MKNINKYGVTLMELLVVITIIGIITVGVSKINLNAMSDKQRVEIFRNNIITNFEAIRSNAITGKSIGINLLNPTKWKIEFSKAGSGSIKTYYSSGANWENYEEIIFDKHYKLTNIECLNIDESISQTGSIAIIEITGTDLTLTGSCVTPDTKNKKIKTTIKYKNKFEEIIEINTVNGLIENL